MGAGASAAPAPSALSPSPRISATFSPTFATPPSPTKISWSTPSSKASISMVALSVSTSARMSPISIWSPCFFFQRAMVPSTIVSLNLGMVIIGMGM